MQSAYDIWDNKGGGLAFKVHTTVLFESLLNFPKDNHIKALGIKVSGNSLINIDIPPVSICSAGYVTDITPYLPTGDGYLYGDINAQTLSGTLQSKMPEEPSPAKKLATATSGSSTPTPPPPAFPPMGSPPPPTSPWHPPPCSPTPTGKPTHL